MLVAKILLDHYRVKLFPQHGDQKSRAAGDAIFGPRVYYTEGSVVYNDQWDGCSLAENSTQFNGKIALIKRGTCPFVVKTLFAEIAGAIGVLHTDFTDGIQPQMGCGGMTSPCHHLSLERIEELAREDSWHFLLRVCVCDIVDIPALYVNNATASLILSGSTEYVQMRSPWRDAEAFFAEAERFKASHSKQ
jgi:hypothetical protein